MSGNKAMTQEVQNQLLSDPKVQALIKQKGEEALSDPDVQAQILATCKEKFPEYAGNAAAAAKEWAMDPATQAKAKQLGGMALGYAANAGDLVLKQIEQGPAGVRMLTFLISCASCVLAAMDLINPLSIIGHAPLYTTSIYQVIFACTTILFEVPVDWHKKVQDTTGIPIDNYQNMLIENAKFLSLNGGRGIFYFFQGTLWLAVSEITELFNMAVALGLLFVGILHILMHFNIMPKDVATKMRDGYKSVAGSSGAAGSGAAAPLNP